MRVLAVTMIDLRQEPNQRMHHVLRNLAELADETVVAMKVRNRGRSLRELVRDSVTFRVEESRHGRVRILAVDPLLNYAHAMGAGVVHGQLGARAGRARSLVATALSLLGIARDVVLVPAFVTTLLARTRGTFDVCVAQGPWEAAVGWALKRLGRVRLLVYDDIDLVAGGQMLRLRSAYVAWLERTLIRRADVAISSGWLLGDHRRRTTGREVLVIPNGVDPAHFRPAREKRPHPPTLVYMGNVAHYAGVDLAIRALPRIRAGLRRARLVIVGGGDPPYLAALRRLVADEGLTDAVEFRGPVPYSALPAILAQSDIGLATFRPGPLGAYAFPLKVVEYMAAGLAVIGTEASETAEILRRYPCGRAVPFDEASFATAVLELLADPEVYARSVETAVRGAEELTWVRAMEAHRAAVVTALA